MINRKQIISLTKQTLIITLITFGMTEIVFRVYASINPTFIFYDSSYNRYRGKPFSPNYDDKLNSQGFQGPEFTQEKPDNTYRILSIGDSFTFGILPVQYNYNSRIQRQLNRQLGDQGKQFQVINMGIPSIGPRDYLALLVNEGINLNPDMVMISVFIGNDTLEAEREMENQRDWYTYSHVLSFFNYVIQVQSKYEGELYGPNATYDESKPSLAADKFLEIQTGRATIFIKDNIEAMEAFNNQVEYIKQIKKICDSKNIKLLVVLIPDETQVNPELQQQVITNAQIDPADLDIKLPNRLFTEVFTKEKIEYLDLLDGFLVASKEENLYKPQDTHWNIAGNRVASRLITPKIIEQIQP
ncbi:MAG: hypothetical protein HC916_07330 [Coleofasciculaceae cyanobacterium SM2_1_6]|nr:hypothetical protein [Coleofasciculaceae cyanobacterium SM2_1_6]